MLSVHASKKIKITLNNHINQISILNILREQSSENTVSSQPQLKNATAHAAALRIFIQSIYPPSQNTTKIFTRI